MQRIITVRLEDVYPLEDEYGNQYMSRDYSTKANQEYIQELADSMRMKGIPDEPISVVADGGIYRIKTGNSRVMAMRDLGTVECPAIIDDEDTVQSVIEAVVRTDTKKKYEEIERSRFTQQLFMFGNDDYVNEVTGLGIEKVKRIRRAAKKVDDAAEDMTLDRLLIIDEFSDDPDAVETLTSCKEADVSNIADRLRRARKAAEEMAALREAYGQQGVPVVEDRAEVGKMTYYCTCSDPGNVEESLPPEWEDGQVIVWLCKEWSGARATVYIAGDLSDVDEEQAALREREKAYERALEEMDEARFEWFWENLASGKPMPNLLRECAEHFEDGYYASAAIKNMGEECLAAARNKGYSIYDYAIGFDAISTEGSRWFDDALASGEIKEYRRSTCHKYLDELALYQADGWDPGDHRELIKELSDLLDGEEEGEGND